MPEETQNRSDAVEELPVSVSAVLAERSFSVEDLLEVRPGAVLDFRKAADAPLELRVNGSPVGRGRAVERGGRLGLLVEELSGSLEREGAERKSS